jgi:kynurenine 3-monooxygenase
LTWKPQALNSFEHKIWDVSLLQRFILVKLNEEHGKIKSMIWFLVQMVLFQIRHRNTHQNMFDYSQEFLPIGYKELNIPAMLMNIN